MNWKTFKIYDSLVQAHMMQGKLESEGIESKLVDHNIVGVDPLASFAVGGIKLQIQESDIERATQLIAEIEAKPITDDNDQIIHCPKCGSQNLASGYTSAKSTKGIIGALVGFLFTAHPLHIDTVYYCNDCKNDFLPQQASEIY